MTLWTCEYSQDRRLFALVLCWWALRYYTYWTVLDYVELEYQLCLWMTAVNFVNQFRHGIYLEATTSRPPMFPFYFVLLCVLSAFHTDRCHLWLLVSRLCEVVPCVARMRWILCIYTVALKLRKTISYVACVITETGVRCSRRWVLRLLD